MKFRRSAPLFLISAIVLVVVAASIISSLLFTRMISSVEEKQFSLMHSIVAFNLRGAEDRAQARASMIADLPRARALFAAQDRAGLLAEYSKMFADQKDKYGVDQAQFHSLPATSFLRLNFPESFGDDLSKSRPIVVAVNRDQTPRKGFAIARSGPVIVGVVPMFDPQEKHIGSFEFGIAFDDLLYNLKNAYGLEMAVFIDEASLHEFAKGVDPGVFSDQNRVGKFIRFHSTSTAVFQSLVSDKDLNTTENTQYTREAHGVTYGIVLVPLRNGAGEVIGIVAATSDFSASRSSRSRAFVWQALIALFSIVLLAGITLIIIRGTLLRPLEVITSRFATLSDGDTSAEIPEPERLCDELKGLAHQYEKLRRVNKEETE
jgi:nitrogen fixation/metabolism regulation signal transduction histidine kinase